MGSNPLMRSTLTGIAMQGVMVLIGKFVPAVGTIPNFFPICGTVLAAITGALAARGSAGAAAGKVAADGAIAGGASSVVGGFLAVATGQWPGFAIVQMLGPAISGSVAGGVGGIVSRMLGGRRSA